MVTRNRVALVTGGTRGIGRAITERLADSGVDVAAGYASDCVAAESVRDRLEKRGARITLHRVDVGDPDSCRRLVNDVLDQHGRIDYLINNAGTVTEQRYGDISADDWQQHLAVNLSAAFFLTQAAITAMVERRFGRIVNIGSVSAAMGSPVQIPYAAAKSGLVGLTRSTARAVARKGITVNCVVPGSFDTELSQSLAITDRDMVTSMIPVGRWGRPEELAHAVAFLLDDMSSYITGAVLTVDGGMSMGG
ncbi:SDR family NAD(P)-dependent oxidoreductase [Mycobacterium sp.]|uniref:SDR family NAD(P)-dependent oxidoreductase n=1 Tax=Mycobacterium sp. TaxID=1785 RepID=UPI003C788FB8